MNGLDPAGMHEMRAMIASLVDEGRTVMLSSHLLDEVERTCDAVAIVDRGRVIRQGPIDELVRGAGGRVVRVDCSDPATAGRLIEEAGIAAGLTLDERERRMTGGPLRESMSVAFYWFFRVERHFHWFLAVPRQHARDRYGPLAAGPYPPGRRRETKVPGRWPGTSFVAPTGFEPALPP